MSTDLPADLEISVGDLQSTHPQLYRTAERFLASGWSEPGSYSMDIEDLHSAGLSIADLKHAMLTLLEALTYGTQWSGILSTVATNREHTAVAFILVCRLNP